MAELLNLLFNPLSNGIMTVLTGITALYWIFTFISGDFLGDMDFSTEFDSDIDVSADTDVDADINDNTGDKSFLSKSMEFINIGKVPFMVVYSTFKFIAWIITLASSMVFGFSAFGWKSALFLIPIFGVTYFITRFATKPFIRIYKAMGYNGEEKHDLIGRVARMRSSISGNKIGSAELVINQDVIKVSVKSKDGQVLPYNSEVMIADESADKRYYLVVPEVNLSNVI